jgi:putative hydrolase of HD superfamily
MKKINDKVKAYSDFFKIAEQLKTELRHCYTNNSTRKESVAEHTWLLSLMAVLFFHEADIELDKLKVLKMIIVHDMAEIFFEDMPAFEKSTRKDNKHELEKNAFEKLLTYIPNKEAKNELRNLWNEYEECNTPEAIYAKSLDKIEPLIQHNISDIKSWEQGDFDINPYYKKEMFGKEADKFLKDFKDQIDIETMEKIEDANQIDRVSQKHLDLWKKESK